MEKKNENVRVFLQYTLDPLIQGWGNQMANQFLWSECTRQCRSQAQLRWAMSISSGSLKVSAAPNFLLPSSHSSSSSSTASLSSPWLSWPGDGNDGSLTLLDLQGSFASMVTCLRWEISTTTVSSSFGRGCFHGSPSTLRNVWSAAPLWNSKRTLWACQAGCWY